MRGNRGDGAGDYHAGGPIPACAGEPLDGTDIADWLRAYPRVCGGTLSQVSRISTPYGLSPRVRGTANARDQALKALGLSPRVRGTAI